MGGYENDMFVVLFNYLLCNVVGDICGFCQIGVQGLLLGFLLCLIIYFCNWVRYENFCVIDQDIDIVYFFSYCFYYVFYCFWMVDIGLDCKVAFVSKVVDGIGCSNFIVVEIDGYVCICFCKSLSCSFVDIMGVVCNQNLFVCKIYRFGGFIVIK